jgi:hypothetical protein
MASYVASPLSVVYGAPQYGAPQPGAPQYGAPQYGAPQYGAPQYLASPDVSQIKDWLIWSIINLFIGWGGGLLPLIFSIICRNNKNNNDAHGARTMSTLALVFNILATIGGVIGWIYLIVALAVLSPYYT